MTDATRARRQCRRLRRVATMVAMLAAVMAAPSARWLPSAAAQSCVGDCGGDGAVSVNELIIGVNIALGTADVCSCPSFVSDGSATVSINKLIGAVGNALSVCPALIRITGSCARQPRSHGRTFVPCDRTTPVYTYSCEGRTNDCLQDGTRAILARNQVCDEGQWQLDVPAADANLLLAFEAEVANGVVFRTLDFGSVGAHSSARAPAAAGDSGGVEISPVTEAGVRLIEDNQLSNFSDEEIGAVMAVVDQATAGISFENLSPSDAAAMAVQVASQDPEVIMVIATAAPAATPTATSTDSPTASDTPTATSTPSTTETAADTATPTETPTATPTGTPNCKTTIAGGLVVNETWGLAGSPYCLTADTDVSLLAVEPGVEVFVDGPYEINVLSTLVVQGTGAAPVRFAAKDYLQPWKGLRFQNTPPGSSLSHCIIESSTRSGLTLIEASGLSISDCVFQDNGSATNGGAIDAVDVTGDLNLQRCTFNDNTALNGGALHVAMGSGAALVVADSAFSRNVANPNRASGFDVGGAIFIETGDAAISGSRFVDNTSRSACYSPFGCDVVARGGAIFMQGGGTLTIDAFSQFVGNQVEAFNGGDCFFGGSSRALGAAVYVESGAVSLTNCSMACNSNFASGSACGASADGGGLFVNGGEVHVANSTIARNPRATGVAVSAGELTVDSSIVYRNNDDGLQVTGTPTITYSDVEGGFSGTGNINFDPVFAGRGCELEDLRIVAGSPCIDTGNPDALFNDCVPPSLGSPRNDMGIFGGPGACGFAGP